MMIVFKTSLDLWTIYNGSNQILWPWVTLAAKDPGKVGEIAAVVGYNLDFWGCFPRRDSKIFHKTNTREN